MIRKCIDRQNLNSFIDHLTRWRSIRLFKKEKMTASDLEAVRSLLQNSISLHSRLSKICLLLVVSLLYSYAIKLFMLGLGTASLSVLFLRNLDGQMPQQSNRD